MKTRERIKRLRQTQSFGERVSVAADQLPGTAFDRTFHELATMWAWNGQGKPGAVKNATARQEAAGLRCVVEGLAKSHPKAGREQRAEIEEGARELFLWAGQTLAGICAKGDSATLRDMADALDQWGAHTPQPDRLRHGVIVAHARLKRINGQVSMRQLMALLRKLEVKACADNGPRTVRRICRELRLRLKGKPGRPTA